VQHDEARWRALSHAASRSTSAIRAAIVSDSTPQFLHLFFDGQSSRRKWFRVPMHGCSEISWGTAWLRAPHNRAHYLISFLDAA
jgi:hypothetical protein